MTHSTMTHQSPTHRIDTVLVDERTGWQGYAIIYTYHDGGTSVVWEMLCKDGSTWHEELTDDELDAFDEQIVMAMNLGDYVDLAE